MHRIIAFAFGFFASATENLGAAWKLGGRDARAPARHPWGPRE